MGILTALVRMDIDATIPPQLIAIHEITQLSRNYTNTPSKVGRAALTELIERLKQESVYLEHPEQYPDFFHGPIHILMDGYGSYDPRVPKIIAGSPYTEMCRLYRLFCEDWVKRLSAWLDDTERLTETENRVTGAYVFLERWYELESGRLTRSNRGHPKDLAETGIIQQEALVDLVQGTWRPKE